MLNFPPPDAMIPEVFVNQSFNRAPAKDVTPPDIFPPYSVSTLNSLGLSNVTSPNQMTGQPAAVSSCDNLDIISTTNVTSAIVPDMPGLTYRSESTPDLCHQSTDENGRHPEAAALTLLESSHEFNSERNSLTLPLMQMSGVKRSNLKKRLYTPSSFYSTLDQRPQTEAGKKSISFSSIVHIQSDSESDSEHLLESGNTFPFPRSNSESGPRPSLRDLFKRSVQDASVRPSKPAKLEKADPENIADVNKTARTLKNLRAKQMKGVEEQKHRFIVYPVLAEGNMAAGQTSDQVFQPEDNEDTMTSLCGSEWAAQVRGAHQSCGSSSLTSDDVFTSSRSRHSSGQQDGCIPEVLKNSMVIILSGMYGLFLVVLGLVLPISETYADPKKTFFFEVFYLYLYLVSMFFLIYVYTYLLRRENILPKRFTSRLSLRLSRNSSTSQKSGSESGATTPVKTSPTSSNNSDNNSTASFRTRRHKIGFSSETSHHTGSFYLRVGVIAFGIGSMLHSGLMFGHYFEIYHLGHPCSELVEAIKPLAHLCFTFVQMYFIFMNSKMCVHKYKTLARFGLIHMSATNICVWLRSIVVETLHVIMSEQRDHHIKRETLSSVQVIGWNSSQVNATDDDLGSLPEVDCHWDAMIGKIVEKSSLYLYPCTIEYSLVCACVLYVMWSNVGESNNARRLQSLESASDDGVSRASSEGGEEEPNHRMSIDCAGSSRGLFSGIFLFVFCVVCLVCFYVISNSEQHATSAIVMSHISEDVVYIVALFATVMAAQKMRQLHYSTSKETGLEEILLLISLSGLGLFGVFSIVSGSFYAGTVHGGMTILTSVLMLLQAGSQTTFLLAALRASAQHRVQVRDKPGRQYVIFLLVSNFVLWALNTFETQRIDHNVIQTRFYGNTAWAIFTHISVPLGIYYRFHSTVLLSTIWKQAWKIKHHHELHLHG